MKITGLFLGLLLAISSMAQVGNIFPNLLAHQLDNKKIELPLQTKGKFTLLGMAYSKEAEKQLASWYQPVYETFIHKCKPGVFEEETHDVHLFLIPMFTGANQAAHGTAVKEMQKSVDKTLWPYVLVYKGDLKPYKESLALHHKEIPYFFVLDKNGKIIHTTSGMYSDEKMEKIEELLEE